MAPTSGGTATAAVPPWFTTPYPESCIRRPLDHMKRKVAQSRKGLRLRSLILGGEAVG